MHEVIGQLFPSVFDQLKFPNYFYKNYCLFKENLPTLIQGDNFGELGLSINKTRENFVVA